MSDVKYFAYKSKNVTEIDYFNSPGVFIEADLQFNTAVILHKIGDLVNDKYVCERIDLSSTTKFNKLNYLGDPNIIEISKSDFEIVVIQFKEFVKKMDTFNQIFNPIN